jgi:predicted CXXCH cytochrome family protein
MRKRTSPKKSQQPLRIYLAATVILLVGVAATFTDYESYTSLYDADYVGSAVCGECHVIIYDRWLGSPHAKMTRRPTLASVVGDFDDGSWAVPVAARESEFDDLPAIRTYQEDGAYYMALRRPESDEYVPFKIEYVIGYQYRQTYLTRERGGVLRRLPLQWSVQLQDFFPYWNLQEGSLPTVTDLWAQMTSLNSAWNLFCARCHTTHLEILFKDANHTQATTQWTDAGIACEACHGPGSHHVNYFEGNYVNRVVAFINGRLRQQPVAYIATGQKLTRGEDLSICARCHGPDISMTTTEIYRVYEPGYSEEGRINDLSPYFKQFPLEPGRDAPTVEVWDDGDPRGIAMVFRSFVESTCYEQAEVRCYDCHDPHNNKQPAVPGILEPSEASNQYCLGCHGDLAGQITEHTHHEPETAGWYCYDCHLPREIENIVTGVQRLTRSHTMSSIPDPQDSQAFGQENAPNACNECHTGQTPAWAVEQMQAWWGPDSVQRQLLSEHDLETAVSLTIPVPQKASSSP